MMVNLPCLMVSCTNFLRPTCSYTECPLSFLTGSCPTEETTASYSSCLYFDFTDPPIPQGTDIPWTHHPVSFRWSSWWCRTTGTTSLLGFFPEPCPVSELSGTPQGSGIIHSVDCLMLQSLPSFLDVWCPSTSSSWKINLHLSVHPVDCPDPILIQLISEHG